MGVVFHPRSKEYTAELFRSPGANVRLATWRGSFTSNGASRVSKQGEFTFRREDSTLRITELEHYSRAAGQRFAEELLGT